MGAGVSKLVDELLRQLKALKVPKPELEVRFHDTRKWRFDLCWRERLLAVEIDGGTFCGGRHVRPAGYEKDCEKINEAILLGWRVLRFTSRQVKSGEAALMIERFFKRSSKG